MVQAIDRNRKYLTRRLCKIKISPSKIYDNAWNFESKYHAAFNISIEELNTEFLGVLGLSKYKIGDILWVRETWAKTEIGFVYKAKTCGNDKPINGWKPSIFMPKEAARIFLEVTNVRVERLQDISREDAIAEGIERFDDATFWYKNYLNQPLPGCSNPITSFQTLWMAINGAESWQSNPWVWVYEFKKIAKPTNWPL